jgi:hypothetical protein
MREALGDGYTEALRKGMERRRARVRRLRHVLVAQGRRTRPMEKAKRFGFITTNSIHQTFNRRVLEPFLGDPKKPLHLAYAIPDHPWIDSADGAAVRIAMTVAAPGKAEGSLGMVMDEEGSEDGEVAVMLQTRRGTIAANLQVGADVSNCVALRANQLVATRGVVLIGSGFVVEPADLKSFEPDAPIKRYRNGKDLTDKPRGVFVIDCDGLSERQLLDKYPATWQWLHQRVKPERDQNPEAYRRENWWLFGRRNTDLRASLKGLTRYIATPMTAKHRNFLYLTGDILPDQGLISIGLPSAEHLCVLSSGLHILWALKAGGRLGMGNDPRYNNSRCFDTFPFPCAS